MSAPEQRDPRKFPRLVVDAFADCTGSEVILNHRICNISLGGICLQTRSVEDVGTEVDLVINFPKLDVSIALKGEVVWVNRDPPEDMGIRYIKMDDEKKRTLKKYLDQSNRVPG
jgi:uncharacterized protein (TIGR02266 family)